jgi:hypothetical protein
MEINVNPDTAWRVTVSLKFDSEAPTVMELMMMGQELVELCEEQYQVTFVGGCGHIDQSTMSLFFNSPIAAEMFQQDWYISRAKILSKRARDMFSVDPDDIPF